MPTRLIMLLIFVVIALAGATVFVFRDDLFPSPAPHAAPVIAKPVIPPAPVIAAAPVEAPAAPVVAHPAPVLQPVKTPDTDLHSVVNAPSPEALPVLHSKPAPINSGSLASELTAGRRAVTIAANSEGITRGDHVDVLFTHGEITETMLTNISVLAATSRDAFGHAYVTLEVDNIQAQKLALGEKAGSLSLALRSPKDESDENIAAPTRLQGIIHQPAAAPAKTAAEPRIRIIRGIQ
jgi:pilus assembly protein CpaB